MMTLGKDDGKMGEAVRYRLYILHLQSQSGMSGSDCRWISCVRRADFLAGSASEREANDVCSLTFGFRPRIPLSPYTPSSPQSRPPGSFGNVKFPFSIPRRYAHNTHCRCYIDKISAQVASHMPHSRFSFA